MMPNGWAHTAISDLLQSITTGVSVNSQNRPCGPGEIGVLKTSAVTYGVFRPNENKVVLPDEAARARENPEAGCVLFSRMNTIELVGAAAYVPCTYPNLVLPDRIWQLRPATGRVDGRWLHQMLSSPPMRTRLSEVASGTSGSMKNISQEKLRNLLVICPPFPEQRKIAAILSSVDAGIEATQAVIDQLQVVKKAMMAELLTRGLPGRHTRFKQTEIGEVPEGWQVVRAGDVCSVITKGATPAEQTRDTGDVPFLKVYNIDPRGFIDFSYQPTFIPRNIQEGILGRSRVFAGDVLMNIVGPPLGKVAVVPHDFPASNINQAIAVFRPNQVEPFFLATCLKAPFLFAWAATRAKRTSTQLNLTLEICRDYPMPLPPPQERAEINSILAAIEARTSAETDKLEALNATKSALSSALLTGEIRVKPDEATP